MQCNCNMFHLTLVAILHVICEQYNWSQTIPRVAEDIMYSNNIYHQMFSLNYQSCWHLLQMHSKTWLHAGSSQTILHDGSSQTLLHAGNDKNPVVSWEQVSQLVVTGENRSFKQSFILICGLIEMQHCYVHVYTCSSSFILFLRMQFMC